MSSVKKKRSYFYHGYAELVELRYWNWDLKTKKLRGLEAPTMGCEWTWKAGSEESSSCWREVRKKEKVNRGERHNGAGYPVVSVLPVEFVNSQWATLYLWLSDEHPERILNCWSLTWPRFLIPFADVSNSRDSFLTPRYYNYNYKGGSLFSFLVSCRFCIAPLLRARYTRPVAAHLHT